MVLSDMKGRFLRPVKGEEWIEEFRREEFWIGQKRSYRQNFYARLCKSYMGWWLYFRIFSVWHKAALLIDPLSCGGLWSHVSCFCYNFFTISIWYGLRRKVWKIFHRKQWEDQMRFMRACLQASEEGCADDMPAPPGLEGRFIGNILGKRYFERVAEIMREKRD